MRRRRPTGDELDDESYIAALPVLGGDISAMSHPYELTDEQVEELEAELAEKLRRKRPIGFAPWPEDA